MIKTDRLYRPEFFATEERIIQWFDESVERNTFMYISTEDKKVIGYSPITVPPGCIISAVHKLRDERLLNVSFENSYCAHGPFYAIILEPNVDKWPEGGI